MAGRKSNLRAEVIGADPTWPLTSRRGTEYEASSHKGDARKFEATFASRGAYHNVVADGDLDHNQGLDNPTPGDL